MSATRRVDGPQATDAASIATLTEALAAITHACALVERDELLRHLTVSWRQLTKSTQVTLSAHDDARRVSHSVTVRLDGEATLHKMKWPQNSDRPDSVKDRPENFDPGCANHPERIVLTSSVSPRPIGELILWEARSLPNDLQSYLSQCTADLLFRALANDRVLQEAKLKALGEFAAGAGHEINNPIAAISGRAQLLLRGETDPQRRQHLLTIGAQALRVRDMIGDTMLFARPPEPQPQLWNLTEVVSQVQEKFAEQCQLHRLSIVGEQSDEVPIWADRTQLCVVVSELLRNAIEASPDGGQITIETICETTSDACTWARLTIRDEGPGLSDESREHLFDPFYSGRQAGRGLGFGLSKCWKIVTNHGGWIDTPPADHGSTIVIQWPAEA